MHTVRLTLIGLILLSVFVFVAAQINQRKSQTTVNGARLFILVWLVVSTLNFCVGVFVANYSATTELAVHLVVFGLPAGVAWYLSRRRRAGV